MQVSYLCSSVALRSPTQHARTTHAHPLATNGDNCSKREVVCSLRAASSASESLADLAGLQRSAEGYPSKNGGYPPRDSKSETYIKAA